MLNATSSILEFQLDVEINGAGGLDAHAAQLVAGEISSA